MVRYDTVIVGGGLCGLSAAYHLETSGSADYLVLEREHEVGGLARTVTIDGFSFDHAIHILFSSDPYVADLLQGDLLAGNLLTQVRRSYCRTGGVYTEYPYQLHTFGLPPEVVLAHLRDFLDASRKAGHRAPAPHFEAWIRQTYGASIAERFMLPYNRRQWAWDLRAMSYEWIGDRVAVPDFARVLAGALAPPAERYGPNREFWYPAEGGIEALARALAARLPADRVRTGTAVGAIDACRRELTLADGGRIAYERLISTVPLPTLVGLVGEAVPPAIRTDAAGLASNTVHTVNIGLAGRDAGPTAAMHWVYLPEDATVFHRLSFPGNFSPWMVPEGCSAIQAEISESPYRPCRRATLIRDVLDGLVRIGCLRPDEARPVGEGGRVRVADVVTLSPAYVIYDLHHRERTRRIKDTLDAWDITSCGRFGGWAYLNMDHAILEGRAAAAACVPAPARARAAGQAP